MTDETPPSRTQRKKHVESLQKLGEQLLELRESELKSIPMSDKLREALRMAKSIDSRGALRRQRQYIGKVMRNEDGPAIAEAIERLRQPSRQEIARQHLAEQWRERLLGAGGDGALKEFADAYPLADKTTLLALIESTKSPSQNEAKQASRALFRFIVGVLA